MNVDEALFQTFVTLVCILSLIFHHVSRTTGEDHGDEDMLPLYYVSLSTFFIFSLSFICFRYFNKVGVQITIPPRLCTV